MSASNSRNGVETCNTLTVVFKDIDEKQQHLTYFLQIRKMRCVQKGNKITKTRLEKYDLEMSTKFKLIRK